MILEQIQKKIVTIPFCLDQDCTGEYEDIFQTVTIQCQDKKHKDKAVAVEGNLQASQLPQTDTEKPLHSKNNDSR